ncbi:MAG: peptidoglycan DD-metalloendopeptidase family protein [Bacteroidia bacterium]|nr:peptidoglycan DD-metalloendopeptidase family protein [Bacteroidia bacterium]
MKKIITILSITCISLSGFGATGFLSPDERNGKPGDDKKGTKTAAKREDTTCFVLSQPEPSPEMEETPDTCLITFPSHDLYTSWDVNSAHPYNFNESFKEDSVVITLVQPGDSAFVLPFKGNLTSLFGWRRYRPHYGTDIQLRTGEKVVSAFDGMVRLAKYYYGYGNCVIIRHSNGLETVYAHLSKILVESGQKVNAGSLIGLGGNTGHSYGSHLHFEMRYLGQALDTQDFIDYEKGTLKTNTFVLRKSDVDNKYNLRALHNRHKQDVGMGRYSKSSKAVNGTYVVRNGDNLWLIAKRNKTTVKNLCAKNRIKPNVKLRLGQKLKI